MCITKKELSEYRRLRQNIEILKEKHAEIIEDCKLVKSLNGMPHGTDISKPTEQQVMRLIDVSEQLEETINRKTELFLKIEREIRKLPLKEYAVIHRHYILGESWELVAEKLNYSDRHIRRIHGNALRMLIRSE